MMKNTAEATEISKELMEFVFKKLKLQKWFLVLLKYFLFEEIVSFRFNEHSMMNEKFMKV